MTAKQRTEGPVVPSVQPAPTSAWSQGGLPELLKRQPSVEESRREQSAKSSGRQRSNEVHGWSQSHLQDDDTKSKSPFTSITGTKSNVMDPALNASQAQPEKKDGDDQRSSLQDQRPNLDRVPRRTTALSQSGRDPKAQPAGIARPSSIQRSDKSSKRKIRESQVQTQGRQRYQERQLSHF